MATKKTIKPKIKKYDEGGTSKSFKLFGKTYSKDKTSVENDDDSTTKTTVKSVRYNDGDFKKVKVKTATTNTAGDLIKGSVSKTRFLGDGDVISKRKSYTIPSNSNVLKKGGSVKNKKVIKSKKK